MAKEYPVTERPEREPTYPGEMLRDDVLPALKLSVTAAARQLRITRQTLHRILSGEAAITPEMAVRLGRFCGNGPELWLRMQQNYDLWHAERRLQSEVKKIPAHTQWAAETEATVENCLRALSRFKPGEKLCDVLGNPGTGQDQGGGFKREK